MTSSINTNISALYAQANIAAATTASASSVARLSSGNRIVQASDDVAGLATGTSLQSQVSALKAAQGNASAGTSLLQVADGALQQIENILQQQESIASQAQSGSLTDTDRGFLNQQFQALSAEIDQIASGTSFNGVSLLNGGLGTTESLAGTDALVALVDPTATGENTSAATPVAATGAIQAFDNTGADLSSGVGPGVASAPSAAGQVDVTDSSGNVLSNGAYASVNSAVVGKFSSFQLSNVIYGSSGVATLTATINGVQFSGSVADSATSALIHNGNTYLNLNLSSFDLTDAGTAATSQATLGSDFKNTIFERTSVVGGVDFAGTSLAGAVGGTGFGIAATRLASANANISDFQYGGNTGAADTNIISVNVNGQTFTATNVLDAVAAATPLLTFTSQDGQVLQIDLTGLTTDFTNIRTDSTQQANFINALNTGFSKAGSGLNFTVGSAASDSINVSLASASTNSLFNGQSLSVGDAASAATAATALNGALNTATALRSTVGALESQFGFASANLQTSVQNQSAAASQLLDTDIAAESTNFATEQVKLQAGISVLAQANQQLQALLKLIG